jgi:hypothetical protein
MTSSDSLSAARPPSGRPASAAQVAGRVAATLLAVAGAAWGAWLFYAANDGRERALWGVFKHLLEPYTFGEGNALFGAALVGSWLLTILAGALVVALLKLRNAGRWEALALSWLFGVGAFGLLGEFLAMAMQLQAWPLWGATAALFVFGFWLVRKRWVEDGDRRSDWRWLAPLALPKRRGAEEAPKTPRARRIDSLLVYALNGLTILILLACAWHALLFPVVYWDAMILYVGYARLMFEAGGVYEKIVGQIGIGLGANYPHLFEFHHVAMAKMAGLGWSSVYAQGSSPMSAAATAILGASTLRRLGFGRFAASAAALLVASMPLMSFYTQYASNYLLATGFLAAFLWGAAEFLRRRTWPPLVACFLAAVFSVHVNYLGWVVWMAGAVLVFAALPLANWVGGVPSTEGEADERLALGRSLARSGRFWLLFAAMFALALPWHVRNVIKTGNPVYAFYYNIFPSKNVDPAVMESAVREWRGNGAGIGSHGMAYSMRRGEPNPTLADKLLATPAFFATGGQSYRLAPTFLGFALPGALLWAGLAAFSPLGARRKGDGAEEDEIDPDACDVPPGLFAAQGLVCWFLVAFLLFYHYAVADFYLYQILTIAAPLTFFVAVAVWCVGRLGVAARGAWFAPLALIALSPGLAFALMGGKLFSYGQFQSLQTTLSAFRNPLMDERLFYEARYGAEDPAIWAYANEHLRGKKILTHENRHLAFDPSIELVHLDDWETQQLYNLPTPEAKLDALLDLGLEYYLYVPNEESHRANKRLELDRWRGTPRMEPLLVPSPDKPEASALFRLKRAPAK